MKNLDAIKNIYAKHVSGKLNSDEEMSLLHFFKNAPDDEIAEVIAPYLESEDEPQDLSHLDSDMNRIFKQVSLRTKPQPKKRKLINYIIAAAAIAISFILVDYLYVVPKHKQTGEIVADLSPGTFGATLKLADGRRISMNDAQSGQVAMQGKVKITKNAKGELVYSGTDPVDFTNTLSTERAQTFNLVLPDGTKVWLNAASSITYTASFANLRERTVSITGEVYFEVAHNPKQPFTVKSNNQKVTVLGTKFNVRSYADDEAQITTLAEGSVKVYPKSDAKFILLSPGNEIVNSSEGSFSRRADLETALAWKNGKMYFNDASLTEVLKQVSRWYNVDIDYSTVDTNETFSGGVKRTAKLAGLLKIFEASGLHTTITKIDGINTLKVKQY